MARHSLLASRPNRRVGGIQVVILAGVIASSALSCSESEEQGGSANATSTMAADVESPSGSPDGSEAEASEGELKEAVRAYSEAFLTGDAEAAWALLSGRCQDRLSRPEFNSIVAGGAEMYGDAQMESLKVDVLEGTLARVSYAYDDPSINQDQEPWVFENRWRNDDC